MDHPACACAYNLHCADGRLYPYQLAMTAAKPDAGEKRSVGDRCALGACCRAHRIASCCEPTHEGLHNCDALAFCIQKPVKLAGNSGSCSARFPEDLTDKRCKLRRDSGRFLDSKAPTRSVLDIYAPFWEYSAKLLQVIGVEMVTLSASCMHQGVNA